MTRYYPFVWMKPQFVCLSLMYISVLILRLLWIMLMWKFVCRFSCRQIPSLLYVEAWTFCLFNLMKNCQPVPLWPVLFCFHSRVLRGFWLVYTLTNGTYNSSLSSSWSSLSFLLAIKYYILLVLFCISVMINILGHHFMFCMLSLNKCPLRCFLSFKSSLYILDMSSIWDM